MQISYFHGNNKILPKIEIANWIITSGLMVSILISKLIMDTLHYCFLMLNENESNYNLYYYKPRTHIHTFRYSTEHTH